MLDLDIKSFFDEIDWGLLMRAVRRHTDCKWVLLYLERWLKAPVSMPDGIWSAEKEGPRRGQSSAPCWRISFFTTRSIVGCNGSIRTSRSSAMLMTRSATAEARRRRLRLRQALEQRFADCGLQLHPQKTKVVYCKDANRPGTYPERSFDFLGYTFRPRSARNRDGKHFVSFLPAVSRLAAKRMRQRVRRWRLHQRNDLELEDIATWVRPVLTGWVRYYGRFYPSKLREELRTIDEFIVRWASRKYKRFHGHGWPAGTGCVRLRRRNPQLFAHWSLEPAAG